MSAAPQCAHRSEQRPAAHGACDRQIGRWETIAGFTLIELLAVMAITALLTAIALSAGQTAQDRAAADRTRAQLAVLAQALEEYRQFYGDYPQTGEFAQAAPEAMECIGTDAAQSKFFNALTGVFGPAAFTPGDRLNCRVFLDLAKFTLETTPPSDLGITEGNPLQKKEEANAMVDPWGRRYLYYYKKAGDTAAWRAAGYVLFSAGPDGRQTPPDPASGLEVGGGPTAPGNADNIYAGVLQP